MRLADPNYEYVYLQRGGPTEFVYKFRQYILSPKDAIKADRLPEAYEDRILPKGVDDLGKQEIIALVTSYIDYPQVG